MEIIKVQIETKSVQEFSLPSKAKLLTIQTIEDKPWLLALVNPEAELVKRVIKTYEIGERISGVGKYIGVYNEIGGGTFTYISFDEGEA